MASVVGVRFKTGERVHYFAAAAELAVGDKVVVQTARGPELGSVVIAPDQVIVDELPEPPKAVARKAQPAAQRAGAPAEVSRQGQALGRADLLGRLGRKPLETGAPTRVGERIRRFGLPLNLASAEDESEAPVAAETSAEQDRSLGPGRGAGVSGRLLSCLSDENQRYVERKQRLPRLGQIVQTPAGPGRVIEVKVAQELVKVQLENGTLVDLTGSPPAPAAAGLSRGPSAGQSAEAPGGERPASPPAGERGSRHA